MATKYWYIYTTTDCTKPPDRYGNAQSPTFTTVDFGGYGTYKFYYDPYITTTVENGVLKSYLYPAHAIIGKNINCSGNQELSYWSNEINLRTVIELSTDNFQTIAYSVTQDTVTNQGNGHPYYWFSESWSPYHLAVSIYKRTESGREDTKAYPTLETGERITAGGKEIEIPTSLMGKSFKVRFKQGYQHYTSDSSYWSSTRVVKSFDLFAPFVFNISAPNKVYLNGLNTFDSVIDAKYYSSFEYTTGTYGANSPVRNEAYPYITSGQTTDHIYWAFVSKRGDNEANVEKGTYTLSAFLDMEDPFDSNFKIKVGYGYVSGGLYYQVDDDFSMFDASFEHGDTTGIYEQYGLVLRNTGSRIYSKAHIVLRYGVSGTVRYIPIGGNSYKQLYTGLESKTVEVEQDLNASGSSISTTIQLCSSSNYLIYSTSSVFTATALDYFVPSFPNLAIHRCDEDGTANDNGDHCKIEWSVNIMPINNQNSKKLTISHPDGTTTYNPLGSYTQSGVLIVSASTESSYNIVFTAKDDLNSETRTLILSSAGVVMDWLYGGKGVSFGKVASKKLAVEVGEMWKFICYNLVFSGTDMSVWMKEVIARLKGIEQFASNLESTSQYQVTFYNDSTILDRQWIRSGQDATDPGLTPEKEPTETTAYSFVGWALTNGATTANPNALKNITSYRSIYAAFASATRYYAVFFYNGGTLLNTVTDLQYHGTASYSGNTPTSDTGIFVGWRKSGRYITENTSAYAQFYDDSEITDSWEQIVEACADGTYKEKYKPGNWKMLNLGTEGNIKMRIKGFNIHYGSGMKKLPISWEADTKLATNKRMNPNPVPTYEYVDEPQWGDYSGYWAYFYGWYECRYRSNIRNTEQTVTRATITVQALRSTTLTFGYRVGANSANSNLKITCNGTTVYNAAPSGSSSYRYELGDYSLSMQSGDTATVTVEYYDTTYRTQRLTVSCCGTFGDDRENPPISTTIVTDDITIQYQTGYENGTGNMGGFANSELYNYLHSTVKQLLPDALRTGIKKARLNHSTVKSKPRVSPYYEFVENDKQEAEIFIPSSDEILGSTQGNTNGVDFDVQKYQYRKKGNTSSSGNDSYWCRDASPASNITFSVVNGYSSTDGAANRANYYSYNTRPVYICFCT